MVFVNKDLFSNPIVKQMNPTFKPEQQMPPRKLDMTFMPQNIQTSINKLATVAMNPLSSAEALEERERLLMDTKEREKKARETPIIKSLYDFKGNSKHRVDREDSSGIQQQE